MTDHQILDSILLHMSTRLDDIQRGPEDICREAGVDIENSRAYLMFDMMHNDGYILRKSDTNMSYIILYKGILFVKEGGYKRQKYLSDRQKIASWFSDYFDIIIKPLTIISLVIGTTWVTIQILSKLGMCCH